MTQAQTPEKTNRGRGYPRGRPRGASRVITHSVGAWTWNHDNVLKRIDSAGECWTWLGSRNNWSNLFGAFKNGRAQMTQANRLIYMATTDQAIEDHAVAMTCGNKHCCRFDHMTLVLNKRLFKTDGSPARGSDRCLD